MSTDFSQTQLDSSVTIGQQQLTEATQRIELLEAQLSIYEKQRIEHEDLQKHMRNSYSSFVRDNESLKKNLALAELRNQELVEENIKMKAQLSGKIDLLLNERQEHMKILMNHNTAWFQADRGTTVFLGYLCTKFDKVQVQIDTSEKKIGKIMGIDLKPGKSY